MEKKDHKAKAAELWESMDQNAKHGIRFGLFPADTMRQAEKDGYDGRRLCSELMGCATRDGGMRA